MVRQGLDLKAMTGGADGVVERSQYKPQTRWQEFFRASEDKTQTRIPGTVRFQGLDRDFLDYLKSQECILIQYFPNDFFPCLQG